MAVLEFRPSMMTWRGAAEEQILREAGADVEHHEGFPGVDEGGDLAVAFQVAHETEGGRAFYPLQELPSRRA
jgi:hypothetical protein